MVPGNSELEVLASIRENHPASMMIWEADPAPETEQTLSEIGVASVVFDPCANRPENGDFMTVMRSNLLNIDAAFQGS